MNIDWIKSAYPLKPAHDPWAHFRPLWREQEKQRRWRDAENRQDRTGIPAPVFETPGFIWRQVKLPDLMGVYRVNSGTIHNIVSRRYWRHVE